MSQALEKSVADYLYWQDALVMTDGKRPLTRDEQSRLNITEDIGLGFFRKRREARGPFSVGAAIFVHDGEIVALVDKRQENAEREWLYLAKFPVTEAAYRSWEVNGLWPDDPQDLLACETEVDPAIAASLMAPTVGHNNPPQDEAEILKGQIDAASAGAADYAEIKDDETAAKAQSLRSRLNELSGTADKKREALKRPHLEAGRAVDERWNPMVKAAKAAADMIAKALGAHETRKAREAERVRQEQEDIRIKAERAAARAAAAGKPAPAPPPPAPEPAPAPTATIRGAYGRAATVKAIKIARVTDQAALYPFLATHKELIDLMAALAQRAVTAGLAPPGVEITEEKKVV